jgi:PleD family two-component response regulator
MLRLLVLVAAAAMIVAVAGLAGGDEDLRWLFQALVFGAGLLVLAIALLAQGDSTRARTEYRESLTRVTEQLVELSARDWVTGLLTASEFRERVRVEVSRSRRYGRPCSIAFIDPDLEALRAAASHGRLPGSEELEVFLARVMEPLLRETDALGRREGVFGLAALLPETNGDGAGVVADRIRQRYAGERLVLPDGQAVQVHVHVAAAAYPDDAADDAELLALLDRLSAPEDAS